MSFERNPWGDDSILSQLYKFSIDIYTDMPDENSLNSRYSTILNIWNKAKNRSSQKVT